MLVRPGASHAPSSLRIHPVRLRAGAVALDALGVPWAPLRCLFPVAGLGWELLVDPWATGALTPSNRVVTVTVAIPAVPALVGGTLRHQVFQFQSGVGRAWTGLSATNAVDLAVGRF